jgi:ABC-type antimicrobial peptide transport system permease subunit
MLMTVRQRMREIAMRMALGADSVQVTRLVLGRGGVLVLAGVALGLAGAWAATRLLASLLSGVSPSDPAALGAAAVALGIVALVASWLPARAASRVDPVTVLRME